MVNKKCPGALPTPRPMGGAHRENTNSIAQEQEFDKGLHMDEKIQTGLRLPERQYRELKSMADRAGISVNAAILMLLDIGLSVINRGMQEETRVHSHTPKCSDEQ